MVRYRVRQIYHNINFTIVKHRKKKYDEWRRTENGALSNTFSLKITFYMKQIHVNICPIYFYIFVRNSRGATLLNGQYQIQQQNNNVTKNNCAVCSQFSLSFLLTEQKFSHFKYSKSTAVERLCFFLEISHTKYSIKMNMEQRIVALQNQIFPIDNLLI